MNEIKKEEETYLRLKYPINKLLRSPSLAAGPVGAWALIALFGIQDQLRKITEILLEDKNDKEEKKAENGIQQRRKRVRPDA